MRLYHCRIFEHIIMLLVLAVIVAGCGAAPQATQALITVNLTADGLAIPLQLLAGSTVQQALDQSGLSLNALDRTEPPVYTVLGEGAVVRVVRITEQFEVEQETIPYEHQTLRNESLPKEKEMLIQKGQNGLKEITYRRVYEDGVEVYSQPIPVKAVIVEEPRPEIVMVGIQAPLSPVAVPGRLLYLRDGNLWSIEGSTNNRRALLTIGDLDGRVVALSADGSLLLFTRRSSDTQQINSLWVADLNAAGAPELIDLGVNNIIHFADWYPGAPDKIIFSLVETRSAAPGWQANNDLNSFKFSDTGWTTKMAILLESNSGGVYGWWGTSFVWGPEQSGLAFARPDGIGVVDTVNWVMTTTLDITPLQTRGDWAWVPGLTWGPDGKMLYTVDHVYLPGSASPEESQVFDLTAAPMGDGPILHLAQQVGMFAYPLASPLQTPTPGASGYQVAYLQAIFPAQSETSRYRLAVMDRDGSNRQVLFPPEEAAGLQPQREWGAWSPEPLPESGHYAVAVIYQGNLWLVDVSSGEAYQVTGDGLTSRVIWTPSLAVPTTE